MRLLPHVEILVGGYRDKVNNPTPIIITVDAEFSKHQQNQNKFWTD